MKPLVNILSFILMIVCIGFFDVFSLDPNLDTNTLSIQQDCDADTVSTKLKAKLNLGLNSLRQHGFWSAKTSIDSCEQKELSLLLKQIESNFYTHKIDAGRLTIVKESLTCKN